MASLPDRPIQQHHRNEEQFIHLASRDKADVGHDEFSTELPTRLRES